MGLSRRDLILKYIVDYYIKTAQPVGSHTLIEEYNLPYSSATIRNEMSELEHMGLIEKTHTSSGRVPSVEAYKLYISELMDKSKLSTKEIGKIKEAYLNGNANQDILKRFFEYFVDE